MQLANLEVMGRAYPWLQHTGCRQYQKGEEGLSIDEVVYSVFPWCQ